MYLLFYVVAKIVEDYNNFNLVRILFFMKDRTQKISLFFAAYIIFMLTRIFMFLFTKNTITASKFYTTALSFAVIAALNISIRKKIFHENAIYFLILGVFAWEAFGILAAITGITFPLQSYIYSEIFALVIFHCIIFGTARLIIAFGIYEKILKLSIFMMSITILYGYAAHFDGLNFLSTISNIFISDARYRNSYGLGNPNGTGLFCAVFVMLYAIYRARNRENASTKSTFFEIYITLLHIPAFIMLVSSGSRAAITGLFLFYLANYAINNFSAQSMTFRILLIIFTASAALIIFVMADWRGIFIMSGRIPTYINNFLFLKGHDSLMTGIGILSYGDIGRRFLILRGASLADSFYMYVMFTSGIIGCFIIFVPIFYFLLACLRRAADMPRSYILSCAFLIFAMYRAIFEVSLMYHSPEDFLTWTVLICTFNNKKMYIYSGM